MNAGYFVAIIVYVSSSENFDNYTPLFEECITLIKAATEVEARNNAEQLARSRCC